MQRRDFGDDSQELRTFSRAGDRVGSRLEEKKKRIQEKNTNPEVTEVINLSETSRERVRQSFDNQNDEEEIPTGFLDEKDILDDEETPTGFLDEVDVMKSQGLPSLKVTRIENGRGYDREKEVQSRNIRREETQNSRSDGRRQFPRNYEGASRSSEIRNEREQTDSRGTREARRPAQRSGMTSDRSNSAQSENVSRATKEDLDMERLERIEKSRERRQKQLDGNMGKGTENEKPKKKHTGLKILLGVLIFIIIGLVALIFVRNYLNPDVNVIDYETDSPDDDEDGGGGTYEEGSLTAEIREMLDSCYTDSSKTDIRESITGTDIQNCMELLTEYQNSDEYNDNDYESLYSELSTISSYMSDLIIYDDLNNGNYATPQECQNNIAMIRDSLESYTQSGLKSTMEAKLSILETTLSVTSGTTETESVSGGLDPFMGDMGNTGREPVETGVQNQTNGADNSVPVTESTNTTSGSTGVNTESTTTETSANPQSENTSVENVNNTNAGNTQSESDNNTTAETAFSIG